MVYLVSRDNWLVAPDLIVAAGNPLTVLASTQYLRLSHYRLHRKEAKSIYQSIIGLYIVLYGLTEYLVASTYAQDTEGVGVVS